MSPWPCRRLGDCGEILAGGTPSRSVAAYWRGEIPWISAKSLKSFRIYDSEDRLTTSGAARVAVVQPGAVLFVVRGMSLASEFRIGIAQRAVLAVEIEARCVLRRSRRDQPAVVSDGNEDADFHLAPTRDQVLAAMQQVLCHSGCSMIAGKVAALHRRSHDAVLRLKQTAR